MYEVHTRLKFEVHQGSAGQISNLRSTAQEDTRHRDYKIEKAVLKIPSAQLKGEWCCYEYSSSDTILLAVLTMTKSILWLIILNYVYFTYFNRL